MKRAALTVMLALATLATLATLARAGAQFPNPAKLLATHLERLDHTSLTLASLRGQALLINFWARWCVPCRTEIPALVAFQRRYPQVTVIGIVLDDKREAAAEFAGAYEINYEVLLAGPTGTGLLQALGDSQVGLPYTLAIDGRGEVVFRKLGPMSSSELDLALARLNIAGRAP